MASFNYTTVEGDRIDLLAAKFYLLRLFFRWARCW